MQINFVHCRLDKTQRKVAQSHFSKRHKADISKQLVRWASRLLQHGLRVRLRARTRLLLPLLSTEGWQRRSPAWLPWNLCTLPGRMISSTFKVLLGEAHRQFLIVWFSFLAFCVALNSPKGDMRLTEVFTLSKICSNMPGLKWFKMRGTGLPPRRGELQEAHPACDSTEEVSKLLITQQQIHKRVLSLLLASL